MTLVVVFIFAASSIPQAQSRNISTIAIKTNSFRLLTQQDILDPVKLQSNLNSIIPHLHRLAAPNTSQYNVLRPNENIRYNQMWSQTTMGPLLKHLTTDILNSISQMEQFLTPTTNRHTRNILGNIISSLTGLATQEQLEDNLLNTDEQTDQNLLHIADLTRNQDTIYHRIKQMAEEVQTVYEVVNKNTMSHTTRVLQLTSYALQLTFLAMEYRNMWADIVSAISNGHSNHHSVPLNTILEARETFHKYYGSNNHNTRFGITHGGKFLHIPTIAKSTVDYLLHTTMNQTKLITAINIPIYQHGYSFHTIPNPSSPNTWLLVNADQTEAVVLSHSDRAKMSVYHGTAFLNTREVRISTHQTSCFLDLTKNCHQYDLRALDDNHYLYEGHRAHQLNIDCGQQPIPIKLQRFQILHLPYQCRAYSDTYTIPRFLNDEDQRHIPPTPPDTEENRLIQTTFESLAHQFKHPVLITKITPVQGQLTSTDFTGPVDHLYQRLHDRLERRVLRDQTISSTTFSSVWPIYLVAGLIAIAIAAALIILIYLARFAAPHEQ